MKINQSLLPAVILGLLWGLLSAFFVYAVLDIDGIFILIASTPFLLAGFVVGWIAAIRKGEHEMKALAIYTIVVTVLGILYDLYGIFTGETEISIFIFVTIIYTPIIVFGALVLSKLAK